MFKNELYFGDNLDILKDKIQSDSIDLIYLDPPFKSGKNYNIIFKPELNNIKGATSQIHTFEDTWYWGEVAEKEYEGLITGAITKEKPNQKIIDLIKSMRSYLGECSMMAYLCMMAPRLLEMKRVLKETGSIYLHCDPTASHYLKLLMDAVFGYNDFQNEIVWCYKSGGATDKRWGRKHDVIFFYTKTKNYIFNPQKEKSYMGKDYHTGNKNVVLYDDKDGMGKYTLVNTKDWWEIGMMATSSKERLGYPTQKPEALLDKIINASSNKGDIVLDPFCGCGTTIAVAERLERKWMGIDITYLAIDVIKKRFEKNGITEGIHFEIDGEPTDLFSAEKLSNIDHFQFQIWCVSKLHKDAIPSQVKSGDKGIDGYINFLDLEKANKAGMGIIQVKGGQSINPGMVRDLKGTIKSQNADFGILIILKKPTSGMKIEAVKEGNFKCGRKQIPKIQLISVKDLFKNPIPVELPGNTLPPYKKPDIKKNLQEKLFNKPL